MGAPEPQAKLLPLQMAGGWGLTCLPGAGQALAGMQGHPHSEARLLCPQLVADHEARDHMKAWVEGGVGLCLPLSPPCLLSAVASSSTD